MDVLKTFAQFRERLDKLYKGEESFDRLALDIFQFQSEWNTVYRKFLDLTGRSESTPQSLTQIPFLPVSFFKTHTLQSGIWEPERVFASSGTTKSSRSRHLIQSVSGYTENSIRIFEKQVVPLRKVQILGLLPTYLDNPESSLIEMVRAFGAETPSPSLFFALDFPALEKAILAAKSSGLLPVIFGVSYALLRMASEYPLDLSECLVIETGGMKGLGREMCREEIAETLRKNLNIKTLWSEFGMSEMQSQAYANSSVYRCGYSMRVYCREVEDPLGNSSPSGRGALNLVDLANFSTCSFLASDDLGFVHSPTEFEVYGRLDQSEIRGCNLLFA